MARGEWLLLAGSHLRISALFHRTRFDATASGGLSVHSDREIHSLAPRGPNDSVGWALVVVLLRLLLLLLLCTIGYRVVLNFIIHDFADDVRPRIGKRHRN